MKDEYEPLMDLWHGNHDSKDSWIRIEHDGVPYTVLPRPVPMNVKIGGVPCAVFQTAAFAEVQKLITIWDFQCYVEGLLVGIGIPADFLHRRMVVIVNDKPRFVDYPATLAWKPAVDPAAAGAFWWMATQAA